MEGYTIEDSRERARVTEHHIEGTAYTKYPGNYYGRTDEWDLKTFAKNFKVSIYDYHKGRDLEIDLIGIGPAIANAYRRIMIAEVPSIAIEHCFIYNNTSVIQDEMLAHRMGLIPIRADPTKFKWKTRGLGPENTGPDHTVVFTLKAQCEKLPHYDSEKSGRREDLYKDYRVHSGHLKWQPLKEQAVRFPDKDAIRPVHKGILIAKLSGKQEIDLRLHAVKGIGRDHAKFSPVGTATYRLMPEIVLKEPITGEAAERLKESFTEGVIKIEGKERRAVVADARIDTGSRNVFRYADLKDKVRYDLIKDHYLFKVESTGGIPALDILLQSTYILEYKCEHFLKELQASRLGVDDPSQMVEGV